MAIVSFKHKFIFVKTRKTAGTSLEVHLSEICDAGDIVTPIYPKNDLHNPRNYSRDGKEYFNHMPADLIRHMQPEIFSQFFSFCFERHPVDKCLSYFAMLQHSPRHQKPDNPATWDEYLEQNIFPVDTPSYVDSANNLIVDKIYRYEDLTESLADIAMRLNIPDRPLLVREKSGFRVGVPTVDEVMSNARQRDQIFEAFASSLRFTPYG